MGESHASLKRELNDGISKVFEKERLELVKRLVRALKVKPELYTARGIKANLAAMLDGAAQGEPQLIKRAGDELPMLVISLDSMADALLQELKPPMSFWDAIKDQLEPVNAPFETSDAPLEAVEFPTLSTASTRNREVVAVAR